MPTLRAGQSLGTPGFAEESRAHLQRRLRVLTGAVALITLVLALLFGVSLAQGGRGIGYAVAELLTRFPNAIVTLLVAVSGGLYGLLRWRPWGLGLLSAMDALFLQALVAPTLLLYFQLHWFSFSGFPVVVPFLVLFILARAILIPSTALRTLLFAAPAPLGILWIQLHHGQSFSAPGEPYPASHFTDMVVQNQVLLWGAAIVAATASRVNLGLRRTSYDARHLGQYRIGERIGAGAMGEVYLAEHAMMKRPTAVKLLRPDLTGEAALRRFEQEVRQTSRLSHPNTISIYDYGRTADGIFYYAMEYLEGASLRDVVARTGPMPASRVLHVMRALCGALAEAHGRGLVHRDIKAANVMLCERGGEWDVVKLLDFGLVRELADGPERGLSGTPETMAPEVVAGRGGTASADLYSLCAVGYHALCGRPLFSGDTLAEVLRHQRETVPEPPSNLVAGVPPELEALLLAGLDKDTSRRPDSAEALRTTLDACPDPDPWTPARAREWWIRHRETLRAAPSEAAPTVVDATLVVPH